eukprot:314225-Rhodomonas_salina.2
MLAGHHRRGKGGLGWLAQGASRSAPPGASPPPSPPPSPSPSPPPSPLPCRPCYAQAGGSTAHWLESEGYWLCIGLTLERGWLFVMPRVL